MRIKREKVIFEQNQALEREREQLKHDMDSVATENKELHLKMDILMEENNRYVEHSKDIILICAQCSHQGSQHQVTRTQKVEDNVGAFLNTYI